MVKMNLLYATIATVITLIISSIVGLLYIWMIPLIIIFWFGPTLLRKI